MCFLYALLESLKNGLEFISHLFGVNGDCVSLDFLSLRDQLLLLLVFGFCLPFILAIALTPLIPSGVVAVRDDI